MVSRFVRQSSARAFPGYPDGWPGVLVAGDPLIIDAIAMYRFDPATRARRRCFRHVGVTDVSPRLSYYRGVSWMKWLVLAACTPGSSPSTGSGSATRTIDPGFALRFSATPPVSRSAEVLTIDAAGVAVISRDGVEKKRRTLDAAELEPLKRMLASQELATVVRAPKDWECGDCDSLSLDVTANAGSFKFEWPTEVEESLPPIVTTLHRELDAVKRQVAR